MEPGYWLYGLYMYTHWVFEHDIDVQEANSLSLCFILIFFYYNSFFYTCIFKKKIIALIDEMSVNLKTVWNQSSCMHTHRRDILYTAVPQPVKRVSLFLCHLRYIIFARVNATSLQCNLIVRVDVQDVRNKISVLCITRRKYLYS